ncbi:unnamed protein product [Symbiodinium natans]|uniref:Uncharacterized protein n=1 Tax=Symbiodinium natans TaxID=878477 RepID=A0A812J5Y1_9DINO|nr:unnamed protein product [Symbiodinium natans]
MGVAGSIWAGLLLQAGWVALADLLCLTDGIARDSRRFIPDPDNTSHLGAETPIRLVLFDWPSAAVASTLAAIFIRALGHVAMDCWMSEILFNFEQFVLANPDVAPIDLGSIGYSGENALAVRGSVREAAYASSGLALEFYRSYNVSAHDAAAYFDRISDLKLSHFHPCNTSSNEFANDVEMRLYGKWTGDWAGVVETDSGYIANCPDGHFWISPACRHNTSECIPVLAAGNGWIVYVFMQWSTFYQIPAAIGISKTWDTFTANVAAFRVLFHWWIPDATFHHLDASMLQLPRHKAQEWAVGNYRSADPQSYIAKLVAHSLGSVAPKVQEFLENFDLDLEVAAAVPVEDVACEWIRKNRARWKKWVPVDTQCFGCVGV